MMSDILDNVAQDGLSGFTGGAVTTALLTAAGATTILGIPASLFLPILTLVGIMRGIATALKSNGNPK